MSSRGSGRRAVFNEINITPLTDIFLVLLIIMMVVAPMLDTQGLKLSVPSAGPSPDTTEKPKTIQLVIDAQGGYSINNQTVGLEQLKETLKTQSKEHPDGLMIETNPEASHDALTQAMDNAQAAGITKIAVTEAQGASGGSNETTEAQAQAALSEEEVLPEQ
jgi:biopolymer transport protein ExbD